MSTSLSNETSSASLVELGYSQMLSGSQIGSSSYQNAASKTASSQSKADGQGNNSYTPQSSQAQSSSNQSASTTYTKVKSQELSYSSSGYAQQSSNLISNGAGLTYPFLYSNSIFPGLAQAPTQPAYNYQSASSTNGMQSNQTASTAQTSRRGGKKKAPATQTQSPEMRLFFNLRRRDAQTQPNRGSSHFYKPKNPPTLIEWFKKLTVEERVNALSTVTPHLTEIFIIMHQRIDQKGPSTFALRERNYLDQKYYQQQPYLLPYASFPQVLAQSSSMGDSLNSSFDESFYQRLQNETELMTLRSNEREKMNAEQEIMKHVRLTHYFDSLDTLTVSEELVQDADQFFTLMNQATGNQAFSQQCQFVFDPKIQQNVIEYPHWFKPKSFHSFATWVIVSLEENFWAHYNYDNNINLGTAKVNELASLYREKSDRGSQDVDLQELSKFWGEMSDADKKALIGQLQTNATKEIEQYEANLYQSGGGYHTKTNKSVQSKNMQYSIQIKERKEEKSNAQLQTEMELQYYIDQSQRTGFEQELINVLAFTKFGNTHQRQVLICKTFLDIIKKKYKDDIMENLLLEESVKQNKQDPYSYLIRSSTGQSKKKKKKAVGQPDKNLPSDQTPQLETQEVDLGKSKSQKVKKAKQEGAADKQTAANMSSNDALNGSGMGKQALNLRKKKKGQNQSKKEKDEINKTQDSLNLHQDSYSCDEKDQGKRTGPSLELESEIQSSSQGVSGSNMYDNTTAHQSNNNSNTNSQETISSTTPNASHILQIQSSKSLDLNPVLKQKSYSNSTSKQMKPTSKVESKNYQILQSSQSNNDGQRFKTDKKSKANTAANTYSDNIIFSEDDKTSSKLKEPFTYSESEGESIEVIRQYVLELTNAMISEVCNRVESSSPHRSQQQEKGLQHQQNVNQDLYQLGALPQSQYNNKKKQFYKKSKHDESQDNGSQQEKRKISFNNSKKSFKDDKKYSEDFTENISNTSHSQAPELASNLSKMAQNEKAQERKPSHQENQNNQRKGFGIHLAPNKKQEATNPKPKVSQQNQTATVAQDITDDWAKGVVKQPDTVTKAKQQNQKKSHTQRNNENNQTHNASKAKEHGSHHNQELDTISNSTKDDGCSSQQQAKKKRNRKKPKLNDIEIMNNFMRGLQTSHEEVKHIIEPKSSSNQCQGQKKRNSHHNGNQPPFHRDSRVSQNEETKQLKVANNNQSQGHQYKQKQVKIQTAPIKETQMELTQIPHKPIHDFSNHMMQTSTKSSFDQVEDEKNPEMKGHHPHKHHGPRHHGKNNQKNHVQKPRRQNMASQAHTQLEDIDSVNSNRADCISEKSSKSLNEKVLNSESQQPQNTKAAPFRMLQFTQVNDWDNNSLTDLTGTTNTAADTSLENYPIHIEESKDHIVIEDQSNHIQVSLTDSIDAQNLLKNNTLALTLQQFSSKFIQQTMSQTLQDIQDASMIPPQIPSPGSNMSASAQIYTPQGYNHSQMQMMHGQNYNSVTSFDFNEQQCHPAYQSYQNTPSKTSNHGASKNPFRVSNPQMPQANQDCHQGVNFRTPPQNSKKTSGGQSHNYSNNGTAGVAFKKSTSSGNNKHYQVKEYQQPPKPVPQYIHQMQQQHQMMMQEPQFIHQFSEPSQMYYAPHNPMMDMYYPRPQSQVFYDEASMMNMGHQQPMYYQGTQMPMGSHMNAYNPGMIPQQDISQNPFNYKRVNQAPYFDQSQDLILQIFNSIKFNQQSLSPIPQMSSPPPLADLNPSIGLGLDSLSMPQRIDSQTQYSRENALYEKLDQEIMDFKQKIQTNLDIVKPERDYVLNKIQQVCNEVFIGQLPKLELFGSLITGLALESSDMDLAVTGLYMEDRYSVILQLQKLGQALENWQVLESFKCIETASIPVIKLKIDVLKLRDLEMSFFCSPQDFESRPVSEDARLLSVDITFDDSNSAISKQNLMNPQLFYQELMGQSSINKTHLGLQSCALVQYYIANYPNLKEVSILLKRFLALHNFNSPYYGGLSSYSTVILLVAYMNYFELRANMNLSPSRLLMGFLDFYGNYFDPCSLGINVYNDGSFYQLNTLQDSNIVILDPLNLQNNTTRNSYLTKDILKKFQCAFNNLKSLTLKNPQPPSVSLSSQAETLEKANSQDQNSSIPYEKTSPQETPDQVSGLREWQEGQVKAMGQEPEEIEARNQGKGALSESVNEEPPFHKVNLLEMFFAGVALPVAASGVEVSSQQEPIKTSAASEGVAPVDLHAAPEGLSLGQTV